MDSIRTIVGTIAVVAILAMSTTAFGAPVLLPGDANQDGAVDVSDLGRLATNYNTGEGLTLSDGDFNGDTVVDVSDLGILATNYGETLSGGGEPAPTNTPEPSSILVWLGLATVAALCWRRRG